MRKFIEATLVLGTLISLESANADLMRDLSRLEGYTIVHAGVVTGYISEDGKKEDDFDGCEHGRKLIIDDSYVVTCNTYNYEYAYRPEIIILTKGILAKAIIEEEVYDISL